MDAECLAVLEKIAGIGYLIIGLLLFLIVSTVKRK